MHQPTVFHVGRVWRTLICESESVWERDLEKYKYKNTQIQIHKYTNTNTQICGANTYLRERDLEKAVSQVAVLWITTE